MVGINCMNDYELVLASVKSVHVRIPKVNGLVYLCVTNSKGLGLATIMALYVWLTSTVPVGIKQNGRDRETLFMVGCDTPVVSPNVEATMEPEGEVLCRKLVLVVGYA